MVAQDPDVMDFPWDLDMVFAKLKVESIPVHPHLDYHSQQHPLYRIYPERKALLQIAQYPFCLFVDIPEEDPTALSILKESICQSLWQYGVDVAVPNFLPGSYTLTKNNVKIPAHTLKMALGALGIEYVYIGRFGMKYYLTDLHELSSFASLEGEQVLAADIGHMTRDKHHIWLVGIEANRKGEVRVPNMNLKMKVYPLAPYCQMQPEHGNWVYGSMEIKPRQAPFGQDTGKFIDAYQLLHHWVLGLSKVQAVFPKKRADMNQKKESLEALLQSLEGWKDTLGGFRVETRVTKQGQETLDSMVHRLMVSRQIWDRLLEEGHVKVSKMPISQFLQGAKFAWEACNLESIWGKNPLDPVPGDAASQSSFQLDRDFFLLLLASLGMGSGRFGPTVVHHIKRARGDIAEQPWLAAPHWQPPADAQADVEPGLAALQDAIPDPPHMAAPAAPAAAGSPGEVALRGFLTASLQHPADPKGPAATMEMEDPGNYGATQLDTLTQEERLLLEFLPVKKTRGNSGQPGTGKFWLLYTNGWGNPARKLKKSKGYLTRAALAKAAWQWAGLDWAHRVAYASPF